MSSKKRPPKCRCKQAIKSRSTKSSKRSFFVVFDEKCTFCLGWARYLLKKDEQKLCQFLPLQSGKAPALLEKAGLKQPFPNALILIGVNKKKKAGPAKEDLDQYFVWTGWEAICQLSKILGKRARILQLTGFVPPLLGRPFYRFIAKIRRWLPGKRDLSKGEKGDRFL
ncbi:MAG: DCC1-like thiol-disulfide oxidoreductase family protein [Chlamydiota bacterium]